MTEDAGRPVRWAGATCRVPVHGQRPDAFCPGWTHFTNNVSDLTSLHSTGVTFVTVSNMPLDQIQEYKARMGWKVPFVSCAATASRPAQAPGTSSA